MTEKITEINFNLTGSGDKPHDKNSQVIYRRKNPEDWLMIRPDRPHDAAAHRYPDKDAKARGDRAMKRWFEYLAAKRWFRTFNSWRGLLKSGHSIMVVCDDPGSFEPEFIWPAEPALRSDFWDEFERSRIPVDRRFDAPEDRARLAKLAKDCVDAMRMNAAGRAAELPVKAMREYINPEIQNPPSR